MSSPASYVFSPFRPEPAQWTLPAILNRAAAAHPDRIFVTAPDQSRCLTYEQFYRAALDVAEFLVERGAKPEERLAIFAGNSLDFLVVFAGASLAGLVPVPLNTALPTAVAERQVAETGACWLAADRAGLEALHDLIVDGKTFTEVITTGDDPTNETTAVPLSHCRATRPQKLLSVLPQQMALLMFTSGTTGASKAVTMSHTHAYLFADLARALADMTAEDILVTAFPLFHANALLMTWYAAAIVGAQVALYDRFSASRWLACVRQSRATLTNLIAGSMDAVWGQPPSRDDADNDLRRICAFPANPDTMQAFKARFGVGDIVEAYGQTEICTPVMSPTHTARPAGASGLRVAELFDLMIADPGTGRPVATGDLGELLVRPRIPDAIMRGYFGRADATVAVFRGLWYHTGDIFQQDADGWYYFKDRLAGYIRRRGENVSSHEVAAAISEVAGVSECAVIGVPAPEGSEQEVFAFVVRAAPKVTEAQHIWHDLQSKLPYYAVPRYIAFVDGLPKNGSQRVDLPRLRDMAKTIDAHERMPARPLQSLR